jgi:hypothetical protein
MTKSFLEYIEDVEIEGDIISGDGFIIETGDDEGVETYIIESWDDSVLIAADRTTLDILEELGLLGEASPTVTPGAIPPPTAGQPAAATPKIQVPPIPKLPAQDGDQGDGSFLKTNPDGTKSYAGAFGTFTYDKAGKAIKYDTPSMGGLSQTINLTNQQTTQNYSAGPLNVSQTADASGKRTGGSAEYDMGTTTATKTFEAEYQGRNVPLGKPMAGDVKKSKVYVKKPNGNIVKVNFGDKNLSIKKHIPGRRKSFRARHNCENPGPRWKARYWSCRAW